METKPESVSEAARVAEILERALVAVGDPELRTIVEAIRDSGPVTQIALTYLPKWPRILKEKGIKWCYAMVGTPSGERRVRAIVNRARTVWMMPIASGATGYFIPKTTEAVDEFLSRIQRESKARAVSSMLTAKKMRECLSRPQQDVFLGLMEEAVEFSKGNEQQPKDWLGVVRIQRLKIEELEARIARWGRPSDKKRMERNDDGGNQSKLI